MLIVAFEIAKHLKMILQQSQIYKSEVTGSEFVNFFCSRRDLQGWSNSVATTENDQPTFHTIGVRELPS